MSCERSLFSSPLNFHPRVLLLVHNWSANFSPNTCTQLHSALPLPHQQPSVVSAMASSYDGGSGYRGLGGGIPAFAV